MENKNVNNRINLEKTNTIKVGFCYDFQITDNIENDIFDIKMNYLVSESGMIDCE